MKSIEVLGKRRFKKNCHRTSLIEAVLTEGRERPSVKALIDQYGANSFRSVVKRLWMREAFGPGYTIHSLNYDFPAPLSEEEAMSEKPAEYAPEKSDWELLAPDDAPAKAPDSVPEDETPAKETPTEEAPTKDTPLPEDELSTTDECSEETYKEDPLIGAKPVEGTYLTSIVISVST
jgi:hypothetical protein